MQYSELAGRVGGTKAGGNAREAFEQAGKCPGSQRDGGAAGLSWQIPVLNDNNTRK
jgi:hypothetical protein